MKLPAYPKYKSSDAPWLGDVPEHWITPILRWYLRIGSGDFISNGDVENDTDSRHSIPVIGGNGIMGYTDVNNSVSNTLIVGRVGAYCGNVHLVKKECWVTDNALIINLVDSTFVPEYIFWFLISLRLNDYSNKNAQPLITGEIIKSKKVSIPSPTEQQKIADFLDWKTARIDTLIAKKKQLIEKLREKRMALITQAVTKGLDPDAPMRDSGIPWLGEVPEHWEVMQLRRRWLIYDCKHKTVSFVANGIPLASIREVHDFKVNLNGANTTTEEEYFDMIEGGRKPGLGDILYSRNATVGDAAIVETTETFCMGQDVCLLRSKETHSRYVAYLLRSCALKEQAEALMVGSTFKRINVGQIKGFWVGVPPFGEQVKIASNLDKQTDRIDRMVQKIQSVVSLLIEYRTALITAATTGKIDVRNIRIPKPDQPETTENPS